MHVDITQPDHLSCWSEPLINLDWLFTPSNYITGLPVELRCRNHVSLLTHSDHIGFSQWVVKLIKHNFKCVNLEIAVFKESVNLKDIH